MHSRNLKLVTIFSRNNNISNVPFSSGSKNSNRTVGAPRRNYTIPGGNPGSGAGRGGGAGGSIKESGGSLGQYGAAQEEGYFYQKHRELLAKLKEKLKKDESKEKSPQKSDE